MKLNKFFLLIIISLLLTNCTFLLKSTIENKESLLFTHLKFWENICIDGIIEANYNNLSFRKDISIKKNKQAFRIDIFDAGVFGMHPTPFITAYYDSVLVIRTPDQKTEKLTQADSSGLDLSILFQLSDLYSIKNEIIQHKKLVHKDITIIFSDEMKIIKIYSNKSSASLLLNYSGDLNSISFQKEQKEIINIQIDKITHQIDKINKLIY